MNEILKVGLVSAAPAAEGVNEKATFGPRPFSRKTRESYRQPAEVLAKICATLAAERYGVCYFLREVKAYPEGLVATEWGYASQQQEAAERAAFKHEWDTATEYAWLAVGSANRAEAYFKLGWAKQKIAKYLDLNMELAASLLANTHLLLGELESALPNWPVPKIFGEQLDILDTQVSGLASQHTALEAKGSALFEEIGSCGGPEKRPLNVLNAVLDFGREVHEAVGFSNSCLAAFSSLGSYAFEAVQSASRFCRKGGVDWERILDMAEALKFRRVWGGKDPDPEPEKAVVPSAEDDTVRQKAFADLLSARKASRTPVEEAIVVTARDVPTTADAPLADKPNRRNGKGKKNGRGNGHGEGEEEDEERVPVRVARRTAKQNRGGRRRQMS